MVPQYLPHTHCISSAVVGRDAIETCHGSDDEYREVGL